MAEAILQKTDHSMEVFSAGLHPDDRTDPMAIEVMKEIGIDISDKRPKSYHEFEGKEFDYLITLCDGTKDKIDTVNITSKHRIHLGFEDPRKACCTEKQLISIYRDIRDEIKNELDYFYNRVLIRKPKNQ
jgi:arsenate reductase